MTNIDIQAAWDDVRSLIGDDELKIVMLMKHLELVLEANKSVNITSITEPVEAVYLHVYDSLLGGSLLKNAPEGKIADIGSGGGYPGIPLAINSGRETALIESLTKKAAILERFVAELGIGESISVVAARAEEHAAESAVEYAAICARAVGSLASLMELASPLLKTGGTLIAYKGPDYREELEAAYSIEKQLGMEIAQIEHHEIPQVNAKRTLILVTKTQEAEITLPRRPGRAQNKPLA